MDDPSVRGRLSDVLETRLRIQGNQAQALAGATTELGADPAAPGLPQTDVQVNWSDGDILTYTTQSETTIRVNPNSGTICVAYNDSQHIYEGLGATGYSRSTDGGATFVDGGGFPNGPYNPNDLVHPPPYRIPNADPSLEWRDADGFFYYVAIDLPNELNMWRSTDDCETFSHYSIITGTYGADRVMMAIDNNPDSHYGRFYVAWFTGGQIGVIHSQTISETVATWAAPVLVSAPGQVQAPWPAVDPTTGDVYVAWVFWHTDRTGLMDIRIKRSTDGGKEWSFVNNPLTLANSPHDVAATDDCGNPALFGHIRQFTSPQIVVDRDSNLHVVYSRDPDGVAIGDVTNVYYRRSTDKGVTWEPEVQLNDDATFTDQWNPTVSVGPTGTVVATWYDRRNDHPGNVKYDYYMAISGNNGVTWGPNIRVSDVSSNVAPTHPNFNPLGNWDCYHGDYDQQVQDGAYVYITWSDDRNTQNDHFDPDVWFDKVLVTPETIYLPLVMRELS